MDDWRLTAPAVVKYLPEGYNDQGNYTIDEWTSYSDIGKVFDTKVLTRGAYESVEANYIAAVRRLFDLVNCSEFRVTDLGKHSQKAYFKKHDDLVLFPQYKSMNEGSLYLLSQIETVLKLVLREYATLTITLVDKCNSSVHFGFDYYMYFVSEKDVLILKDEFECLSLFVYPAGKRGLS